MQKLYLVRHGQSEANAAHIIMGQHESDLTKLGREQAKAAGIQAKQHHFDLIVSSPQRRARQTADIIAEQIGYDLQKIVLLDNLKERFVGEFEGKAYDHTTYATADGIINEDVPGIEPLEQLQARAQAALSEIQNLPAQSVLIVCHNWIGRMLLLTANDQPVHLFYQMERLANATLYAITK